MHQQNFLFERISLHSRGWTTQVSLIYYPAVRYAPDIILRLNQTGCLFSSYRFTRLIDNVAVIKYDYLQY